MILYLSFILAASGAKRRGQTQSFPVLSFHRHGSKRAEEPTARSYLTHGQSTLTYISLC